MPSVLFEMLSLHFMNFQGFLFDVCLYLIIIHIKEVTSFYCVCVCLCVWVFISVCECVYCNVIRGSKIENCYLPTCKQIMKGTKVPNLAAVSKLFINPMPA